MKRTMVVAPSNFNYRALGDVINYINYYKSMLDVYLLVKEFNEIKVIDGYTIVNPNTSYGKFLILTADYVIDAGSILSDFKVSQSQYWISIWHGTPYKKMFLDIANKHIVDATKYANGYDCMISSSPFFTNTFLRSAMKYRGEIRELGSSRIDSLINFDNNRITEIKTKCGIPLDKKIVLYSPTYRKKGEVKLSFSVEKLQDILGDEFVIVTKFHYYNFIKDTKGVIDCTDYPEIIDLMCISEFLISDYSSLIIDYALLKKPIFLFQYDKEQYLFDRGVYFDFSDYLPKENIVENEYELINIINKTINIDVNYSLMVNKFYPYEDGRSTKRIIDSLNLNCNPRKSKDLIFLFNDLNEIGGVNTFIVNMAKYYKEKYDTKIFAIAVNEFTNVNAKSYVFKSEYIDYFLSKSEDKDKCIRVLKNTSGNIISLQFGAHRYFQKYLDNKNVVLMYHGDSFNIISKKYSNLYLDYLNSKKIYNYKKFLLLTKGNMEKLSPYLNEEIKSKLSYMNNSIGLSYNEIITNKKNSWAYIGRLSNEKNPFALIEIGKIILDKKLDLKINLYGDGPLKQDLFDKIEQHNLQKIIIIHGYIEDKNKIFKENVGLILTSRDEGFPYVILESYAYGKPVVLFNTFTAAQELIDNGKTGYLIENENYQDMIGKMQLAINLDKNDIKNKYLTFNNEAIFEKWDNLFNEIESETLITKNKKVKTKNNILNKIIIKVIKKVKRFVKKITNKVKDIFPDFVDYLSYYRLERKNLKIIKKLNIKNQVSIIIPYYNNYDTIRPAIDSVIKQKYRYFEIIVVDDGSQKKCEDVVLSYNNKNIKYFYKKNEGPGFARNFGILKSSGEYVMFLDADDQLYKSSIMSLLVYAVANNLEVVSGITQRVYIKSNIREIYISKLYKKTRIINPELDLKIFKDTLATNKIYKKSLLIENNIFFKKGLYEDKMFTALLYSRIKKIGIINKKVHNWMVYGKNTSITTSRSISDLNSRIRVIEEIWDDVPIKTRYMLILIFFTHDLVIYMNEYLHLPKKDRKEVFNRARYVYSKYKDYTYIKLIKTELHKYMFRLVAENDCEAFDKISKIISKAYFEENKDKLGFE